MIELGLVTVYLLLVYYIGIFWDETDDEVVARIGRKLREIMQPPIHGVIFVSPEKQCPHCRDRRVREWLKVRMAKRVTIGLTCWICGRKYSRAERTRGRHSYVE